MGGQAHGEANQRGLHLVVLMQERRGYSNLAQWITVARRPAPKGQYFAYGSDLEGTVSHLPQLARTVAWAGRCAFSLDELRYEYPQELVPEGHTPTTWLRALAEDGVRRHFSQGERPKGQVKTLRPIRSDGLAHKAAQVRFPPT